jgi:hypothetical protein
MSALVRHNIAYICLFLCSLFSSYSRPGFGFSLVYDSTFGEKGVVFTVFYKLWDTVGMKGDLI